MVKWQKRRMFQGLGIKLDDQKAGRSFSRIDLSRMDDRFLQMGSSLIDDAA